MYTITIKNFYENGKLNKGSERILYHIPIQEGEEENVLTDPTVSCDLGKTGSMEFTIHPNHPYYHAIAQMRTIMRVEYDGDTIFRGRVLTIDNTMSGAKRIHCEGDMAFLLDSIQMGTKKEDRKSINLNTYIQQILNTHNQQMQEEGETDKCIYPGDIPGAYRATMVSSIQQVELAVDTFGSDGTEQSMGALETLTKTYGGYFRTRYSSSDKKTYLDWYKYWFSYNSKTNTQPIAITQNIIDAQSNSEVDNIFTALIPIGSNEGEDVYITGYKTDIHGNNNRILVPQITKVFTEDKLNTGYMTKAIFEKAIDQYGIIYKVEKFPNADTQEKLWEYACDWIRTNYVGGITAYDLSAMDMHHVDGSIAKYLVGDKVQLTIHSDMTELDEYNSDERSNTVNRTLLSVKYDLHHPDKNSYTAGIPSDILNREYGTKSTSKSTSGGGGGSGAGAKAGGVGGGGGYDPEQVRLENLDALAYRYVIDSSHNSEEYAALESAHPETASAALKATKAVIKRVLNDPDFGEKELSTIILSGETSRLSMINATTANDIFTRIYGPGWQSDPRYRSVLEQNEMYFDAANAIILDAGTKSINLRGDSSLTNEQIVDALNNANLEADTDDYLNKAGEALTNGSITDQDTVDILQSFITSGGKDSSLLDAAKTELAKYGLDKLTDSEIVKKMEAALTNGSITDPNIVASIKTYVDSGGKEAGALELAKEAVVNLVMNSGGSGGEGTIDVGRSNSGSAFKVNLNQPVTYIDKDGKRVTKTGFVSAEDFRLKDQYDSLGVRLLVVNDLIADRATIGELNAAIARIGTLEATTVKAGQIDTIVINAIQGNTLDLHCSTLNGAGTRWQSLDLMDANGNAVKATFLIQQH